MPVLTPREAVALADRLAAAADRSADPDTAGTLFDVAGDLVNHANGHPTWLAPLAATAHFEGNYPEDECPRSHYDDGRHSDSFYHGNMLLVDGGGASCDWCGARNEEA